MVGGPFRAKHHIREMFFNENIEPEITIQIQGKRNSIEKSAESKSGLPKPLSAYKSYKQPQSFTQSNFFKKAHLNSKLQNSNNEGHIAIKNNFT